MVKLTMQSVILYLSPPLSETGRQNHLEKKDNEVGIDSGLAFPYKIKGKKKKKKERSSNRLRCPATANSIWVLFT